MTEEPSSPDWLTWIPATLIPDSKVMRWALVGGSIAAVIAAASYYLIGSFYGAAEAKARIQEMLPATRTTTLAAMTAATTTLALMLPVLGMSRQIDEKFSRQFFLEIRNISLLATITVCSTLTLLTFITMPVFSSDEVPSEFYVAYYHILIFSVAIIAGLLVSVVVMLYSTISDLVYTIAPNQHQEEK